MNHMKLFSKRHAIVFLACVTCAAIIAVIGCEVGNPSDAYVTISPQTAKLFKNESQDFVASGAVSYDWHLSCTNATATNQIWGTLDRTTGDRVRYTNRRTPSKASNYIQTLTVIGTIGRGNTNTEAITVSAEAYITHRK